MKKDNLQLCFVFSKENCIQCHGCETACKAWNSTETGISLRNIYNIWEGIYPEITCSTLSISCLHCVKPICMERCPTGAIQKRDEDGVVFVDKDQCIGCKVCFQACPFNVPRFNSLGIMEKCSICNTPICVINCPTRALELKYLDISEKLEVESSISRVYIDK